MRLLAAFTCLLIAVSPAASELDLLEPWHDWPSRQIPADPPATETINLREIWRLDCGEEAEFLIGRICTAAPGLDGRVLLVDRQMVQVLVIAPDGRVERILGKEGEGPGEVDGIYRVTSLADGRIGTVEGAEAPNIVIGPRGELVLLDGNDDPAGVWMVAGDPGSLPTAAVRELRSAPPHILVASARTLVTEARLVSSLRELSLISPPDGARTVIVRSVRDFGDMRAEVCESDAHEPLADGRCDVSVTGRVAFAPERDRWLVCIREPDGRGVNWDRPWSPVERTRARIEAVMEDQDLLRDLVLDHEPALGRVRWRPDGRLWVEPGGVAPAQGALACFDEFTPDGMLARRVQLVVPGASTGGRLLVMEDGRFVLLRGFTMTQSDGADARPEVVLLSI